MRSSGGQIVVTVALMDAASDAVRAGARRIRVRSIPPGGPGIRKHRRSAWNGPGRHRVTTAQILASRRRRTVTTPRLIRAQVAPGDIQRSLLKESQEAVLGTDAEIDWQTVVLPPRTCRATYLRRS